VKTFWKLLILAFIAFCCGCSDSTGFDANSSLITVDAGSPSGDVSEGPPPESFLAPNPPVHVIDFTSLTFRNPCYSSQKWKNWMTDESAVTVDTGNGSVTLTALDSSRRTTVENINLSYDKSLKFVASSDLNSGFFNDVYMTNDNGHTVPQPNYLDPYLGQMDLGYLTHVINTGWNSPVSERLKAGTSFTSQSTTGMGHALIYDTYQVNESECNFLYMGTVRAGPAYKSYQSGKENRRISQYDGLQAFMYNSIGQSGSELPAIGKMGIAAATLNKNVKTSLKRMGLQSSFIFINQFSKKFTTDSYGL
jgi:hypothetical protein